MISLVNVTRENHLNYMEGILEIEKASFITPWSREAFIQEVQNPVSHLWVLKVGNAVVGYVCFWVHDRLLQILNLAVHPAKRDQGLGCRLLKETIKEGTADGVEQIWLEVRVSNRTARNLYRKVGFEEVGLRPRYYRDTNEDAVSMSLSLSQKRDREQSIV